MLQSSDQQVYFIIVFPLQHMPQFMTKHQDPYGTHRIHEKGVWTIEGINEPAAFYGCPSTGLDSARHFQSQLVEILLPFIERDFPFCHQPKQVTLGADIIEPMDVPANVAHRLSHKCQCLCHPFLPKPVKW